MNQNIVETVVVVIWVVWFVWMLIAQIRIASLEGRLAVAEEKIKDADIEKGVHQLNESDLDAKLLKRFDIRNKPPS